MKNLVKLEHDILLNQDQCQISYSHNSAQVTLYNFGKWDIFIESGFYFYIRYYYK